MTIIVEVLNRSHFNPDPIFKERVEGSKEYCEGYIAAIRAMYPINTIIDREV